MVRFVGRWRWWIRWLRSCRNHRCLPIRKYGSFRIRNSWNLKHAWGRLVLTGRWYRNGQHRISRKLVWILRFDRLSVVFTLRGSGVYDVRVDLVTSILVFGWWLLIGFLRRILLGRFSRFLNRFPFLNVLRWFLWWQKTRQIPKHPIRYPPGWQKVGKKSMFMTAVSATESAAIVPGHQATIGTLKPPS